MNYVIEIENLSKDYEKGFWKKKKVRALDGLTLQVESGQIFGFLGGNGAGKTTTIKILMSLIFPTEGSAKILGCDIRIHKCTQESDTARKIPTFMITLKRLN
jgi:ABC-2 type transport system ATP-binding protein